VKAKPDAMEKFEKWFGSFLWSGDLKAIHGRAFRRHLRALLRERAEAAVNEVDPVRADGPWHEQASAMQGRIRAAVLGRKRK